MLGRGTRLCPDLFGPSRDKKFFKIFDFCQNLEFFNEHIEAADTKIPESLSKRLFSQRIALIAAVEDYKSTHANAKEH